MNLHLISDEDFEKKIAGILITHIAEENFGVKELSKAAGLDQSYLSKRLQKITGKSVSRFISEIRLRKAMEMLKEGNLTAAEVAYTVGFSSATYFYTCFHEYYGFPPGEVKKRIADGTDEKSSVPGPGIPPNSPGNNTLLSLKKPKIRQALTIISAFVFTGIIVWQALSLMNKDRDNQTGKEIHKREKSIAVLPFKNLSDDKVNQYFADGVMEDILNHLFRIKELRVISRTSVEQFRDVDLAVSDIAGKLGVNFILEGSVQRYEDKVKINVQLIETQNEQHIWAGKFEKKLGDVLITQSEIATQIARELEVSLSQEEIDRVNKIPTQVPEAYNLYLKGRFFWRLRTEEGLQTSLKYFEKAVAADPDYALAYSGLADVYFIQAYRGWEPRIESYSKAKKAALHALKLDKNLAEAHATLGGILTWNDWKWEEARQELMTAIELNPNYASAHQFYSELLFILGEFDKARKHIDLARKLDPFSYVINVMSGLYHYYAGEYDECLATCKMAQDIGLDYEDWPWMIFNVCLMQGKDSLAFESILKVKSIDTVMIRKVFRDSGMKGVLDGLIDSEIRKEYPYMIRIAKWNALMGNRSEALDWLEKTVEMRLSPKTSKTYFPDEISFINIDPEFDVLRKEIRFQVLLKRMGLDHYSKRPVMSNQLPHQTI